MIDHFVLGGFAIFEATDPLARAELDKTAERFDPTVPQSVELHGSPMIQGSKGWRSFPQIDRIQRLQRCTS